MKRTILLLTVVTFLGYSAMSQTTVTYGLKGGITGSNMKYTQSGISVSLTTKIGFYAGAMADINISENFGIQPELTYSLMGAKVKGDVGFGGFLSGKVDLGYLNLPILFKYKNEGFSVFAGPQVSYLLSANSKVDSVSQGVKDAYNKVDFSGIIGASYTLSNGFGLDAHYQLGFANILKASGETAGVSVKNSGFMVGVHYFFNR